MANYSDREMLAFSDIAYERSLSDYDALAANSAKYPDGKVPLSDLLPASRIDEISSTYGISADTISNWKVASSPGDRNGFLACVIETSPEHAAVAFRGSQDMLDPEAALTDWRHNLQLLNRTCTEQQAEADRFIAANRDLLNGYESVGMTGHSLGGNLAEYSTIMARTKRAIAFVKPLTHTEAYRPEKKFVDAVKGFILYDASIVRPKELAVYNVKY